MTFNLNFLLSLGYFADALVKLAVFLALEVVRDEVYLVHALEAFRDVGNLYVLEESVDGYCRDRFREVLAISVDLSLQVVVHARLLVCLHVEATDGDAGCFGNFDVLAAQVGLRVRVVNDDAQTGSKVLPACLQAVLLVVQVLVTDKFVVFHLCRGVRRFAATRAADHDHDLLGPASDQVFDFGDFGRCLERKLTLLGMLLLRVRSYHGLTEKEALWSLEFETYCVCKYFVVG